MKFRIPKQIEVGPHEIAIKKCPLDNAGEYEFQTLEIRINKSLCDSAQKETFFHEVMEASNHIYELGLPHRTIQILGAAIAQVIKSAK